MDAPKGVSIVWRDPLYSRSAEHGSLNVPLRDYSHTLGLMWGFVQATISLTLPRNDAEKWVHAGLGRDIKVYNPGGVIVFRGYVDSIVAEIGGIRFTYGPLADVANRVLATYTARLILGDFITDAGQTETIFASDVTSQQRYGIWEKAIQAGTCMVNPATGYNEAEYTRDAYLRQYKYPQAVTGITPGSSETGTIRLEVKGYHEWLNAYLFQDRMYGGVAPVTQTVTQKIVAALASNPNATVLSASVFRIGTNAALKIDKETQYRTAYTVIEDAAKVGDGTNLWRFYVNEDLEPVFEAVSLVVAYSYHLSDNRQQVFDYITNVPVEPYDVKAGKVVFLSDWLVGEYDYPGVPGADPRVVLINEVRYSTPYGLEISTVALNQFESYVNFKAGGTI